MKKRLFQIALLLSLVLFASCNAKKDIRTKEQDSYTEEQIDSIQEIAARELEKEGNHIMGPFYLGMTSQEFSKEYERIQRENDGLVKFLFEDFEISDDDCRVTLKDDKLYCFGLISKDSYNAEYYSPGNDNPMRPKIFKDISKHFSEKYNTPIGLLSHWKSAHKSIEVKFVEDKSKKPTDNMHFWTKIKIIVYDFHVADSLSQESMRDQWLKNMNQHEATEGL